jgi:acetyl-CoA carboxylase carboxyl transferase subunit alpha
MSKSTKATTLPPLDFEKPLVAIQEKIAELEVLSREANVVLDEDIDRLKHQAEEIRQRVYHNLAPMQKLQIARHSHRPNVIEVANLLSPELWFELHGDRGGCDDRAIVGGIIELNNKPVMVVGTQKGRGLKENLAHNFGMANPEGYRKALRLFNHAQKFNMPVVTLIDTPGAYPGLHGEQFGIGQAIALNIREMARLTVPVVSVVLGEGSSGGALGIGVANRIYMLEHAIYCVISPEGCASILWRDAKFAGTAAEAMKLTAQDLLVQGIIDGIIPEPLGGAHHEPAMLVDNLRHTLIHAIDELLLLSPEAMVQQRYDKYRAIGAFEEASGNCQQPAAASFATT